MVASCAAWSAQEGGIRLGLDVTSTPSRCLNGAASADASAVLLDVARVHAAAELAREQGETR